MFSNAEHVHRTIPTSRVVSMLDSHNVAVTLVNGTNILHRLQEYEYANDNNTCAALVLSPDLTQVFRLYTSCTVSYYASFICFSESEQSILKRGSKSESYELIMNETAYLLRPPSIVCRKHEVLVNDGCHVLVPLNIPKRLAEVHAYYRHKFKGQRCKFRFAAKCWATMFMNYSTTLEGKYFLFNNRNVMGLLE